MSCRLASFMVSVYICTTTEGLCVLYPNYRNRLSFLLRAACSASHVEALNFVKGYNSFYQVQFFVNGIRRMVCFAVHGGYSEWAEWSLCSVSCGVGIQKRLRQCNNPLPANGGRHCAGSDTETRICQGRPCPGERTSIKHI